MDIKFKDNIIINNPVMVQSLGIVPVLALTKDLKQALVISLAVIFVSLLSNIFVSSFKKLIDEEFEYIAYMSIIASFSTIAVILIEKFLPDMALGMGIYLPLIVVNTLILYRVRTYAIFSSIGNSILDAISNGIGFLFIMLEIAFIRELFGMGTLFGTRIIPEKYTLPIFSTPVFAFIMVGIYFAFYNWFVRHQKLKGAK